MFRRSPLALVALAPLLLAGAACTGTTSGNDGTGGAGPSGASGGATTPPGSGGRANGSGGANASGGATTPGNSGGSTPSGGATTPGSGGRNGSGGAPGSGGSPAAGGSTPFAATYLIGADISRVQTDAANTMYTDTDGTQKTFITLLKGHGFNAARVRTFVDPRAADGNSKTTGFYDIPHTATFGKQIKDAGLFFLLDFHYSDNWADPGKQCVPVAWQGAATIGDLATLLHDYTRDAIAQLVAAGARPDMVQIGNEITPGMLIHRCNANGLPIAGMNNPVTGNVNPDNGAVSWPNLGALLKAGAQGIKDVDPAIKIMIHIDRGGDVATSRWFIMNAMAQGVPFEVVGESSYVLYQGPASAWMSNYSMLATMFPTLQFVGAEYGPEARALNDAVFGLPNRQGLGTFYWEPTHQGADNAGAELFNGRTATSVFGVYDQMRTAYSGRL